MVYNIQLISGNYEKEIFNLNFVEIIIVYYTNMHNIHLYNYLQSKNFII